MPESFNAVKTALYIIIVINVFVIEVGSTIPINNTLNGTGSPTINRAESRKTVPLIIVPIKDITPTEKLFNFILDRNFIKKKSITQVISLSIKFGICPPGKVVVKAVIIPPNKAVRIAFLKLLFINKETKMNESIKSNFMLPKVPGTIW
ncbi:hypothetical protein BET03_05275 [Thermohalobacter berrensis]|uniref:Uncharacterized protein n=1 Tax=Thermohalobacter berrensis TaxID=99594 RepID=A0A419SY32_9FIRM|nr:hypothetical protein BET03_05275 [Thermohalobacter berrensis]